MCKIVKKLRLICDEDNPNDQKILLLTEMVEDKFEQMGSSINSLNSSLAKTNEKLDTLTDLLENYKETSKRCPVKSNNFNVMLFLIEHPRISVLLIIGIVFVLAGLLTPEATSLIKNFIK